MSYTKRDNNMKTLTLNIIQALKATFVNGNANNVQLAISFIVLATPAFIVLFTLGHFHN